MTRYAGLIDELAKIEESLAPYCESETLYGRQVIEYKAFSGEMRQRVVEGLPASDTYKNIYMDVLILCCCTLAALTAWLVTEHPIYGWLLLSAVYFWTVTSHIEFSYLKEKARIDRIPDMAYQLAQIIKEGLKEYGVSDKKAYDRLAAEDYYSLQSRSREAKEEQKRNDAIEQATRQLRIRLEQSLARENQLEDELERSRLGEALEEQLPKATIDQATQELRIELEQSLAREKQSKDQLERSQSPPVTRFYNRRESCLVQDLTQQLNAQSSETEQFNAQNEQFKAEIQVLTRENNALKHSKALENQAQKKVENRLLKEIENLKFLSAQQYLQNRLPSPPASEVIDKGDNAYPEAAIVSSPPASSPMVAVPVTAEEPSIDTDTSMDHVPHPVSVVFEDVFSQSQGLDPVAAILSPPAPPSPIVAVPVVTAEESFNDTDASMDQVPHPAPIIPSQTQGPVTSDFDQVNVRKLKKSRVASLWAMKLVDRYQLKSNRKAALSTKCFTLDRRWRVTELKSKTQKQRKLLLQQALRKASQVSESEEMQVDEMTDEQFAHLMGGMERTIDVPRNSPPAEVSESEEMEDWVSNDFDPSKMTTEQFDNLLDTLNVVLPPWNPLPEEVETSEPMNTNFQELLLSLADSGLTDVPDEADDFLGGLVNDGLYAPELNLFEATMRDDGPDVPASQSVDSSATAIDPTLTFDWTAPVESVDSSATAIDPALSFDFNSPPQTVDSATTVDPALIFNWTAPANTSSVPDQEVTSPSKRKPEFDHYIDPEPNRPTLKLGYIVPRLPHKPKKPSLLSQHVQNAEDIELDTPEPVHAPVSVPIPQTNTTNQGRITSPNKRKSEAEDNEHVSKKPALFEQQDQSTDAVMVEASTDTPNADKEVQKPLSFNDSIDYPESPKSIANGVSNTTLPLIIPVPLGNLKDVSTNPFKSVTFESLQQTPNPVAHFELPFNSVSLVQLSLPSFKPFGRTEPPSPTPQRPSRKRSADDVDLDISIISTTEYPNNGTGETKQEGKRKKMETQAEKQKHCIPLSLRLTNFSTTKNAEAFIESLWLLLLQKRSKFTKEDFQTVDGNFAIIHTKFNLPGWNSIIDELQTLEEEIEANKKRLGLLDLTQNGQALQDFAALIEREEMNNGARPSNSKRKSPLKQMPVRDCPRLSRNQSVDFKFIGACPSTNFSFSYGGGHSFAAPMAPIQAPK